MVSKAFSLSQGSFTYLLPKIDKDTLENITCNWSHFKDSILYYGTELINFISYYLEYIFNNIKAAGCYLFELFLSSVWITTSYLYFLIVDNINNFLIWVRTIYLDISIIFYAVMSLFENAGFHYTFMDMGGGDISSYDIKEIEKSMDTSMHMDGGRDPSGVNNSSGGNSSSSAPISNSSGGNSSSSAPTSNSRGVSLPRIRNIFSYPLPPSDTLPAIATEVAQNSHLISSDPAQTLAAKLEFRMDQLDTQEGLWKLRGKNIGASIMMYGQEVSLTREEVLSVVTKSQMDPARQSIAQVTAENLRSGEILGVRLNPVELRSTQAGDIVKLVRSQTGSTWDTMKNNRNDLRQLVEIAKSPWR
uniref:Uncharacterized protein n=1 Tax=Hirsutella thompsonii TaxID=42368 RepID=A0A3G2ZP51_HIRTH|nr:hypothetical protein [Hirsutella thompsonii]AYP41284.1 hypothetical protein [Hirsutella thompsonii]AYP41313.1 hypothetical protein [Hirsutella thompsonii]AYP41342.1 hypothetical protein [Hirsutella thompsonii]